MLSVIPEPTTPSFLAVGVPQATTVLTTARSKADVRPAASSLCLTYRLSHDGSLRSADFSRAVRDSDAVNLIAACILSVANARTSAS